MDGLSDEATRRGVIDHLVRYIETDTVWYVSGRCSELTIYQLPRRGAGRPRTTAEGALGSTLGVVEGVIRDHDELGRKLLARSTV